MWFLPSLAIMLPSDYSLSDGIMEEPRVFCRCVMGDCIKGIWFHGVIKNNQARYCVSVLVSKTFSLKLGRKLIAIWSLSHVQLFCDPMDCSLPVSFFHRIYQERTLEWVAISFSRWPSHPRNRTQVSCIAGRFMTAEPPVIMSDLCGKVWNIFPPHHKCMN